jgi:2-C-methyl-D-erythritol 4-phosphate cytidylyltransferase
VVIHDAAHPLVRERLLHDVIARVRDGADGGVCVLPMTQVVEQVEDGIVVEVLPKGGQVLGQSPTAFRADVLRHAHADEAEVVEDVGLVVSRGGRVATTPGDPLNIHITTVEEWVMACALARIRDEDAGGLLPDAAGPVPARRPGR